LLYGGAKEERKEKNEKREIWGERVYNKVYAFSSILCENFMAYT
jgi:hypothetical protein